ncbi:hypothetical protein KJV04_004099 [Salmonella enterica]|nr:hypothetical protein [Salmonella enterica]
MTTAKERHIKQYSKAAYASHTGIKLGTGWVARRIIGVKSFVDNAHRVFVEKWASAVSQPETFDGDYGFFVVVANTPESMAALNTLIDAVYYEKETAHVEPNKTEYEYHKYTRMRNISGVEYTKMCGAKLRRGEYAYYIYCPIKVIALSMRSRMVYKGYYASRLIEDGENWGFCVVSDMETADFREMEYNWFKNNYCEYKQGDDGRIYDRYGLIYSEYKEDLFVIFRKFVNVWFSNKEHRMTIYAEYDRLFEVALRADKESPSLESIANIVEGEKAGTGKKLLPELAAVREIHNIRSTQEEIRFNAGAVGVNTFKETKKEEKGFFLIGGILATVALAGLAYVGM